MMIELTIDREKISKPMMKVDLKIEVKAIDHQEFLKNLHQMHMLEIPILDPNMLVDKVLTIILEIS